MTRTDSTSPAAQITITPTHTAARAEGSRYGYQVHCELCPRDLGRWKAGWGAGLAARVHNREAHRSAAEVVRVEEAGHGSR